MGAAQTLWPDLLHRHPDMQLYCNNLSNSQSGNKDFMSVGDANVNCTSTNLWLFDKSSYHCQQPPPLFQWRLWSSVDRWRTVPTCEYRTITAHLLKNTTRSPNIQYSHTSQIINSSDILKMSLKLTFILWSLFWDSLSHWNDWEQVCGQAWLLPVHIQTTRFKEWHWWYYSLLSQR